jgi:hypothetical protein
MIDMMILAQQSGDAASDQARRNCCRMSLMDIKLSKQRSREEGNAQFAWQRGIDPCHYA